MADNVLVDNGGLTDYNVASDDDGTSQHQYVKMEWGADGVFTKVSTGANALPVQDGGNSLTVDAPTGTPVNVQIGDGTRQATVRDTGTSDSLNVSIVDASGNQITSFGGSGGTAMSDDAAFTVGTTSFTPAGGTYKSVRDLVDDNDGGAFAMTQRRAIYSAIETPAGDSAMDETNDAVKVSIVADSVASVTQYTEGDVDTTISGLAILWEDASDTLRVPSAAKPLPVGDAGGSLTVDGSVSLAAAIPAGTNNIGDVDVLSVVPGTAATSLGKAEDGLHSTGDVGVAVWAVRNDGASSAFAGNGDYSPFSVDSNGRLFGLVTGPVAHDAGATAWEPLLMGGVASAAAPTDVTADGDAVRAWFDRAGRLQIGDGGGSLTVDGTVAVSGSVDTELPTAAALSSDNVAAPTAPAVGAFLFNYDGTNYDRVRGDSTDGLLVNLGANNDVIQATASNLNAQVVGTIAHDGVDSGNPVKLGHKAIAHGTNPTAVAANDRTDWYANRAGVPWVIGGHPNVVTIRANYTAAQTDTAIVTVGAGTKIVVTRCSVLADKANTVDVQARVGFGTANTPTTTGVVLTHPGIAAGSGVVEGNGSGMLGVGADNEDLRITSEVPTSGSIDVLVTYYTIES